MVALLPPARPDLACDASHDPTQIVR